MNGPKHPDQYADRLLNCEEDLEAGVIALLDRATVVGWKRGESQTAITSLIDNIALGDRANAETQRKISEAMERLRNRRDG